jgi:quinol monooxygenase YgiN
MPIIVVTRLRLRDPSLLDEFFTHAAAVLEQAMKAEGNLGADALAEAHDAWWSVTAWQQRAQMDAYINTEPHRSTESLLDHLCDEASFVDWEQPCSISTPTSLRS